MGQLSKGFQTTKNSIENLKLDNLNEANSFKSNFGYNEIQELKTLFNYAQQIDKNYPSTSESKLLYKNFDEIHSDIIKKFDIKNFLNFGSLYSHIDYNLAKKFNETNFICSDRSAMTKVINEKLFGDLNNIKFIDDDIFDFLKDKVFSEGLFFSTRTLVLLPKEFILKLYKHVSDSGFKYISLMEQIGISHQTLSHYQFSDDDKPSVAFRNGMYLHNYIGILKSSGYKILESKLIKTDHPHEDYRILSVLAKKI